MGRWASGLKPLLDLDRFAGSRVRSASWISTRNAITTGLLRLKLHRHRTNVFANSNRLESAYGAPFTLY